jgi:hypothetical protein
MDVYVIPIGQDQYELYCEPSVDPPAEVDREPTSGLFGRFRRRFVEMIRAAEDGPRDASPASKSWLGRKQDRLLGWVAQRIAEQRLLWNLRRLTSAEAAHPHDMTFEEVMTLVRRTLRRDYERHRLWLAIDAVGLIVSGPIAVIPGPNILAYYFTFRVFGHWLSMRGASQGLHRITWSGRPCPPLTELRDLASLETAAREAHIQDIADRLRLQHLTIFFARVASRHA